MPPRLLVERETAGDVRGCLSVNHPAERPGDGRIRPFEQPGDPSVNASLPQQPYHRLRADVDVVVFNEDEGERPAPELRIEERLHGLVSPRDRAQGSAVGQPVRRRPKQPFAPVVDE